MTPGNESDGRIDRSKWEPIEVRREQIRRWQEDARFHRLERDRWADDGGAV